MNSRAAISALFILIAAMVVASQRAGLVENLKVLQASSANKISEVRALSSLDHLCTGGAGNPPRAAGTISPDTQSITFTLPQATHFLGSLVRPLQRFVLNLINSDHQGD